MTLPANIGTCLVTGTFIRAVIDSTDADRDPDGVPVEGMTVKFTASVPRVRDVSAVPPATVFIDPITCTTNISGTLIGLDGQPGIRLVASDDPDLDPSGWTYTVWLSAPSITAVQFSFVAPVGGTVDLSTVVPVPASPGASLVAWQEAVVTATAARDEAVIAAADADAARDEAVIVAAAIPATNDPIVAALVNDPVSDTAVALSATIEADKARVIAGGWRFNKAPAIRTSTGSAVVGKAVGDTNAGLFNIQHNGDYGYLLHLTSAADSTPGTALLGLGTDYGSADAILISQKASGVGINAISNPSSTGGGIVDLVQWSKTGRALRVFNKVGVNPAAFYIQKGEGFADGAMTTGSAVITSATANFTAGDVGSTISQTTSRGEPIVIPSSTTIVSVTNATTAVLSKAATGTASGMNFQIGGRTPSMSQKWLEGYDYNGALRWEVSPALFKTVDMNVESRVSSDAASNRVFSTPQETRYYQNKTADGTWWAHYIQASGGILRFRLYNPTSTTVGGESLYTDMIQMTSGAIGFFGKPPAPRPSAVPVTVEAVHAALVTLGLITA